MIVGLAVIAIVLIGLCLATKWAVDNTKSAEELDEEFLLPALREQAAKRGLSEADVQRAYSLHRGLERHHG